MGTFETHIKKISFLIIISLSVIITNEVLAQNFQHRKKFYIDNTQVQGSVDHTNFPVLVSFTDPSFATISNSGYVTNSNGYDIVFTSSDGLTQLDHELTNYDPTTGQVSAWVRFPSLSTTSDTYFFIYFGNPSVSSDLSTNSTWSNEFSGVYHLDNGSNDATSNANNCTNYAVSYTTGVTQIDGSSVFDTSSDYLSCGNNSSITPSSAITVSAWVYSVDDNTDWDVIGGTTTDTNWDDGYALYIDDKSNVRFSINGYNNEYAQSDISMVETWNYVVGTYDKDAGGTDEVKIYVNGIKGDRDGELS